MLKHALAGAAGSALVFGLLLYRPPALLPVQDPPAVQRARPAVLPTIKSQREAAAPPGQSDIDAAVKRTIEQHTAALPSLQERFTEEPVDRQFAATQEPLVWDKVSKLPGVQSAVVQCRTYHCKVTVTGPVQPSVSLDIPGLTYRGAENGALVFLYNPDLAAAE